MYWSACGQNPMHKVFRAQDVKRIAMVRQPDGVKPSLRSRDSQQAIAKIVEISGRELAFNFRVRLLPYWRGAGK
jgi:hypothetical protein